MVQSELGRYSDQFGEGENASSYKAESEIIRTTIIGCVLCYSQWQRRIDCRLMERRRMDRNTWVLKYGKRSLGITVVALLLQFALFSASGNAQDSLPAVMRKTSSDTVPSTHPIPKVSRCYPTRQRRRLVTQRPWSKSSRAWSLSITKTM